MTALLNDMLAFLSARTNLPASRFIGGHLCQGYPWTCTFPLHAIVTHITWVKLTRASPIWLARAIPRKWLEPAGSLPSMDNSNAKEETGRLDAAATVGAVQRSERQVYNSLMPQFTRTLRLKVKTAPGGSMSTGR